MELDHFRPRKYPEYGHLKNDPNNLVWSCHKCNNLKLEHWPALGTLSTVLDNEGFVDPFVEDRRGYFEILENGELCALKPPAEYMINLLLLNRKGLKLCREKRILSYRESQELKQYIEEIDNYLQKGNLSDIQKSDLIKNRTFFQGRVVRIIEVDLDFQLH